MSGNKQIIHFLSASDRINYGDLLFPIIFQKAAEKLKEPIQFYNYGLVSSNLGHFGALKTDSYRILLKRVKKLKGKVVIGGGEVLFADWRKLYSFINPLYNFLMRSYRVNKLETRFRIVEKILINSNVEIPFCPDLSELEGCEVICYNSVGGQFKGKNNSKHNLKLKSRLSDSKWISVRDQRTFKSLKQYLDTISLVPDSALIMSDFFSKSELLVFCSKEFKSQLLEEPYLFLQLGAHKAPKKLRAFVKDLASLADELDLKVVLCPIGMAPGHEDHVILKRIQTLEKKFNYLQPNNIYDIMTCIAQSSLFIGTSLHGVITAQSFNVPMVGLNRKISKLDSYMKTWVNTDYGCIDFDELSRVVEDYNRWNYENLKLKTEEQKKLVYSNIKSILEVE